MLLRSAGIPFVVRTSRVDEEALVAHWHDEHPAVLADPHGLTQALARAKALDVAEQVRAGVLGGAGPGLGQRALVLGADSMLAFEGVILGKAATPQEVRERWAAMAGGTGVLVTGHAVVDLTMGGQHPSGEDRLVEATVATTVRFGRPDPEELEAYIASGEPLEVAGSCTIDGLGGAFIDGVDGDHTNVIGLALPTLRRLLAELGVRWTDLWEPNQAQE
jgi:septum formation protein